MNQNRSVFSSNDPNLITECYGYNQSVQELREDFLAFKKASFSTQLLIAGLGLCLFWAFSNLFLKLNDQIGYVHGLQLDYLIPKLYMLDLLTLGWVSLYGVATKCRFFKKLAWLSRRQWLAGFVLIILLVIWGLYQLWTPFPQVGWLTLGRYGLYLTFFFLAKEFLHSHPKYQRTLKAVFWLGILIQVGVGVGQFFSQRSLTPYWLFGESYLATQPGLARASFSWLDDLLGTHFGLRMLPYGTLPHPNVLAGFLAVGMLVLLFSTPRLSWQKIGKISGLLCLGLLLFLTQSVSAWLLVLLTLIVKKFTAKVSTSQLWSGLMLGLIAVPLGLSLLATNSSNTSILRRHWLNLASWQLWQESPLLGVGAGQVTAQIETATRSPEVVTFVQPPHHVGLLFLAENGLLGIAVVLLILFIFKAKYSLLATLFLLLPLITLDHYLLSFPQGWWLIFLCWQFINSNLKIQKSNS